MRALCALLVLAAAAAVFPAAASAETWKGKTGQKRAVVVRTGSGGVVDRVRIGWKAHCAKGQWYKSRTLFLPPLDSATRSSFVHAGSYRGHPKGYTARIWVRIAGDLDSGDQTWSGTLRVRVRVFQGGERVDTCRIRRLGWKASPVS